MDKNILEETAKKMMTRPKGILAMDESSPTIAKRLASINTENNEINRRRYREQHGRRGELRYRQV